LLLVFHDSSLHFGSRSISHLRKSAHEYLDVATIKPCNNSRFSRPLLRKVTHLLSKSFGVSVYLARPVLDSILFAVALAVGLIPELLPAIISVNLAKGFTNPIDETLRAQRQFDLSGYQKLDEVPLNKWLGFSPLPVSFILVFAGITGGYLIVSEMTKKFFYRRTHYELLSREPGPRRPDSWISR